VPIDPNAVPQAGNALPTYSAEAFDAFIVPLPEKIFYPASAVERQSLQFYLLLRGADPTLPAPQDILRRYFVTTVAALRRFATERRSELGDNLVNMIMRLKTAQFVWVVEYASDQQWQNGHVAARAIVDATASPHDPMPVWFAHDERRAIHFDRTSANVTMTAADLNRPAGVPLGRMEQNLRPVR
jgi:hypothetical protein